MEDFNLMYTFVPHLENHGETEEIDCKFSSLTVNLPVSTSTGEAAQELNRKEHNFSAPIFPNSRSKI